MDDETAQGETAQELSGRSFQSRVEVAMPAGRRKELVACGRPFVIAQLGQSLDGRIATTSGESKYINGPHALDHLHALRASVDAVVVGVGTVMADNPLLTVRRAAGRSPARVVIDPSGRADPAARCFYADGARRMVVRRPAAAAPPPSDIEEICIDGDGAFSPAAILEALSLKGFSRILVEGGPHTLRCFLDAGAIDRLHIFVSPVILGAGRIGLERGACDSLADALRPPTRVEVFPDGDVLFECDLSGVEAAGSTAEREVMSREPDDTSEPAPGYPPGYPPSYPVCAAG